MSPLYNLLEAMVRQSKKDIERARSLGDQAGWVERQRAESAREFIAMVTAWLVEYRKVKEV